MAALGFHTLRFWNPEVLSETDAVLEKILQVADTLTPALTPALSPQAGRGGVLQCSDDLVRLQFIDLTGTQAQPVG